VSHLFRHGLSAIAIEVAQKEARRFLGREAEGHRGADSVSGPRYDDSFILQFHWLVSHFLRSKRMC
jgi:hypothetical protein